MDKPSHISTLVFVAACGLFPDFGIWLKSRLQVWPVSGVYSKYFHVASWGNSVHSRNHGMRTLCRAYVVIQSYNANLRPCILLSTAVVRHLALTWQLPAWRCQLPPKSWFTCLADLPHFISIKSRTVCLVDFSLHLLSSSPPYKATLDATVVNRNGFLFHQDISKGFILCANHRDVESDWLPLLSFFSFSQVILL